MSVIVSPDNEREAEQLYSQIEAALPSFASLTTPPQEWSGTAAQWLAQQTASLRLWLPLILAVAQQQGAAIVAPKKPPILRKSKRNANE